VLTAATLAGSVARRVARASGCALIPKAEAGGSRGRYRPLMDRRTAWDVGPVLLLAGLGTAELLTVPDLREPAWAEVGMAMAFAIPLLWRRVRPLAVLVVLLTLVRVFTEVTGVADAAGSPFACMLVATYAAGAHSRRRRARLAIGFIALWLSTFAIDAREPVNDVIFIGGILYAVLGAALVVRSRQELAGALAVRTVELEHEREAAAGLAVAEERQRIARELHDVVAHSLSVIVLQAGAERRDLAAERPSSAATLGTIEQTARSALGEMRRLLGVLRDPEEGPSLAPPPGLARLPELAAQVGDAGLRVSLRVTGEPQPLPTGFDLSCYRIVQESLTNALRHGGATSATVAVQHRNGEVRLEILDDGTATPAHDHAPGHGLVGMRERAALFGGELSAGPAERGGWQVRARLPVPADAAVLATEPDTGVRA
jgi:signal transduction histidine kinase